MWRSRVESISGSYSGRIAPPGMPKTTSAPASSSERTMDCAPVTCSGPIAFATTRGAATGLVTLAVGAGVGVRGGAGWGLWTIDVSLVLRGSCRVVLSGGVLGGEHRKAPRAAERAG